VRSCGVLPSVHGLGLHDHVCLPFADRDDLRRATTTYLADGRRLGQRLLYVGGRDEERLRDDLAALPGAARLLADGALQIRSLRSVYEAGRPIDPEAQLSTYAEATERALKEGFTGRRGAAEATELVADPATWDAHVHWEAVADRYMASMPLSAMCCYDRRALPDQLVADLARVHPSVRDAAGLSEFQLYSARERNTMILRGEVDYFCVDDLDRLLSTAAPESGRTVLDIGGLEFIDQYGVKLLAERAGGSAGGSLRVRNVPDHARRLCGLLGVEL
jgi:anti-anti-sigma regulatory factor